MTNLNFIFNSHEPSYLLKPKSYLLFHNKQLQIYREIKALIKRLSIQITRQPSQLIVGIIQPLLWLILFGALFQNAPINLLEKYDLQYNQFLSSGMIIFTAFTGSINGGLPIIFDREFGFFNRILASPLTNKDSIGFALIAYTWSVTIIEISTVGCFTAIYQHNTLNNQYLISIILIATLIIFNIGNISICLGFILPGHIEFLAFILIINLPTLFSSTALAPLSFMPSWLQMIACLNPLTYAIEILRNINTYNNFYIVETIWFKLNIKESFLIIIVMNFLSLIITKKILRYKYP